MSKLGNILTSQKTYATLIASLLVATPLLYGIGTGLLIALLAVSLVSLRYHKMEFNKALLLPVLFYFLMVLSLLWTVNVKESTRGLERQLAMLLVPLAFMFMPAISKRTRDLILYWFSLGMAIIAVLFVVVAIWDYFHDQDPGRFFYHALVAPLDLNAIYVSVLVSWCIAYLFFSKRKNWQTYVSLGILSAFLFLLSSKAVTITLVILLVAGVLLKFRRKIIILFVSLLILSISLVAITNNPIKTRFNVEVTSSNLTDILTCDLFDKEYYWTGTTIRLFQARIFSEMLNEDRIFLTGYGINASQEKITEKHLAYDLYKGFHNYNFHNQYIQAFAELGIFGLLFLFLLLGVILREYIRGKDILFLSLFFIMFVVFMTESYLWRQRGLYHFLVLYCLLFKAIPPIKELTTNEP